MKEVLEFAVEVFKSPYAPSILLLCGFIWLSRWTRATIARNRQETQIDLLECKADGVIELDFNKRLRTICSEYRMLYMTAIGGKRLGSPEFDRLDIRFDEIRRQMHDENNRRILRLRDRANELLKQYSEEKLK